MLHIAKKFFEKFEAHSVKGEGRSLESDLRVAACALLLEMSLIDGNFSETEKEKLLSILRQEYNLSNEEAESLIKRSGEELDESIDLWQFTSALNQHFSVEEKTRLVEKIWEIAYADGIVDQHENYLVHKVADLLHLSHKQLINAKLKVAKKV
ncbi:MAG: TerB family tellurite resistance protein [Deltaproteobacteria bacterium]|nr:TerB family tellurite resistance protein [Deltaproteobacteria bacterium]